MATRVQLLRGTAAEWIADDIVIPQGEFAIEIDGSNDFTGVLKVGNGNDAYSVLPIFNVGGGTQIKFEAWNFDDGVADADPGSGNFRFDNVDPTLATFIFISNDNAQGQDLSEILDDLATGSNIGMQQISNIAKAFLYDVSADVIDAGAYRKILVTFLSQGGGGVFGDTETIAFSLIPVGSAVVGTDEPERIDFEDNLDTLYQTQHIMPLQIADILSPGISAITYSAAPDDGTFDFAGNVENVNIVALNIYLAAQTNGTWHVVRRVVTLSRASSIRVVKNLA